MAKRFYATRSCPLVALLTSFPKTLLLAYSPLVTLAGQAILLFLLYLRLAATLRLYVGNSLSLICSPQDICWWPLLIWNFLYEAYSKDHIFPSHRFSILICFLFPPISLIKSSHIIQFTSLLHLWFNVNLPVLETKLYEGRCLCLSCSPVYVKHQLQSLG